MSVFDDGRVVICEVTSNESEELEKIKEAEELLRVMRHEDSTLCFQLLSLELLMSEM